MYCPRRFALLSLNRDWNENAFVVKADLLHEHVHDGSHSFSDKNKVVRSAVTVFNDQSEYDIFGVTDCVEFVKDNDGVEICGLTGKYKVRLVEYKPKAPKGEPFRESDAIQAFAQKLCADHVWGCDSEAFIFYSDIKKRVRLPFDTAYEKYDEMIRSLISEMRELSENALIPKRKRGQKCSGCSIHDMCFPKDSEYNVRKIVMSQKGADMS
ncbi:MAG: Dna2/Cas4 domain-containing protein [Ruminococcus sp.]|nr:Dna2/Cas4 domain-containing protein [Ruminococcus sp.]